MTNNELYHHGVKGQKWGVRRYQNPDGTLTDKGKKKYRSVEVTKSEKTGENVYLLEKRKSSLNKALSKISSKMRDESEKDYWYDAYVNGRRIGEMQLYKESNTSINGVWLGVRERERGKGYATAIFDRGLVIAKEKGANQFTLEVPGNSPDARHIYESRGFKDSHIVSTPEDDPIWDGLTAMKKRL